LTVTFDPNHHFWKKLSESVPRGMEILKTFDEALRLSFEDVDLDWTTNKELGVQVIWKRDKSKEDIQLIGFYQGGPIYTDTPVQTVFGESDDEQKRALPLLMAFTAELATSLGYPTRIDDAHPNRIPTASFAPSDGQQANLKSIDPKVLLKWPDCIRRFKSAVEASEISELARRKAPYLRAEFVEALDRETPADAVKIPNNIKVLMDRDLPDSVLEGLSVVRRLKVRHRSAMIAIAFKKQREKGGKLQCDECQGDASQLDPTGRLTGKSIHNRSMFDAHHKNPMFAGERVTSISDFLLLCPNCHRMEHLIFSADQKIAAALLSAQSQSSGIISPIELSVAAN
jgi:hypothetical protein